MPKRITEEKRITEFFGTNVFSEDTMRKYVPESAIEELKALQVSGGELSRELADVFAEAMKEWAIKNGATHYTHWFQPLTGFTAEKHDSFISIDKSGNTILQFTGKNLSRGEADASSFPSGNIRATFEARGYTVWDCSSPAFLKNTSDGVCVLCIPTAFCSYNGQILDKKTPLLKSMKALDKQGMRVLRLAGNKTSKKISVNVGAEQEYFLVDKNDYMQRADLRFTGRTLFGAPAPKGQEKNDQYYATIRDRVGAFMADLNEALWKLGINAKTQHNEVAPAQHELAPIYATANIATDNNQLVMEMMKKIAEKHNLACLLHEKPFNGVNGSGKHDNWSIVTDDGINLTDPTKNPDDNLPFLAFFAATIAAVDEYADLLRVSASQVGNDLRLGGFEAPPVVISVFVGELEALVDRLLQGLHGERKHRNILKLGELVFPTLRQDRSDRNRTSPFAFTGNKFEFRMVGSSASIATPNTVLNTITAEMLERMADQTEELIKEGSNSEDALKKVIIEFLSKHRRVIFNGNNYDAEWLKEAERRGLEQINNCVDAYQTLLRDKNVAVYEKQGVLTREELTSRYEIYLENYSKTINIEATTMLMMAKTQLVPNFGKYLVRIAECASAVKNLGVEPRSQMKALTWYQENYDNLVSAVESLEKLLPDVKGECDELQKAIDYRDKVVPAMEKVRFFADELEKNTDRECYGMPTYSDIMFYN
ncbi:MAG: glutamine synthetase III [Clostridia bacterium]|nr:glutamine synthetase III [Clostridia bacterium]